MNYQIIACEQVPADSEVYQITKYDSEKTEKHDLAVAVDEEITRNVVRRITVVDGLRGV